LHVLITDRLFIDAGDFVGECKKQLTFILGSAVFICSAVIKVENS
jgi:hypothetical protein